MSPRPGYLGMLSKFTKFIVPGTYIDKLPQLIDYVRSTSLAYAANPVDRLENPA